eukprot:5032389-Pyramimonas_sp.AAC.1
MSGEGKPPRCWSGWPRPEPYRILGGKLGPHWSWLLLSTGREEDRPGIGLPQSAGEKPRNLTSV